MVDFQSQAKQWGYLYSAPTFTDPVHSTRSHNRNLEPLLFKTERIPGNVLTYSLFHGSNCQPMIIWQFSQTQPYY